MRAPNAYAGNLPMVPMVVSRGYVCMLYAGVTGSIVVAEFLNGSTAWSYTFQGPGDVIPIDPLIFGTVYLYSGGPVSYIFLQRDLAPSFRVGVSSVDIISPLDNGGNVKVDVELPVDAGDTGVNIRTLNADRDSVDATIANPLDGLWVGAELEHQTDYGANGTSCPKNGILYIAVKATGGVAITWSDGTTMGNLVTAAAVASEIYLFQLPVHSGTSYTIGGGTVVGGGVIV